MFKKFVSVAIPLALALSFATPAFAAGSAVPPPPLFVATVSYDFVTVDSGVFGGYWAYDTFHSVVSIFQLDEDIYRLVWADIATFNSWAGPSPNNTGTIADGVTGTVSGGQSVIVYGELKESLPSYLGSFDFGCDHFANCPDYVSWRTLIFDEVESYYYEWWGWTYQTCDGRTWVNADYGNSGDITGGPKDCPTLTLEVRNLWAFINPGATEGKHNICYILSDGQPGRDTLKRLCFTEVAPDWWQGASLLTHGDVYDNGTSWGWWEGDAAAAAFSFAKRLPLFAPGPNNDLLEKAEMYPWTQGY